MDRSNPRSRSKVAIPQAVLHRGREAVETYKRALPHGERWAEMCALQIAPGTKGTDRAFMYGRYNQQQFDDMPPKFANRMLREAKAAGIDTAGKYYLGGLADKRAYTDPSAWVDSTADILRVARKRNLTVEGIVTHKGEAVPPKRTVLSETIISEEMKHYRKLHPGKKREELREMIINRHAHPAKRKGK
jgi:hypothetical protein